jgi:hypothetical protein
MMDDLKILRDGWDEPEAPSRTAHTQARAALLARTADPALPSGRSHRRFRLPRMGVGLVAVGALAAIAAAVVVVQTSGGTDKDGRPRSRVPVPLVGSAVLAANVLDQASAAAETRRYIPARAHEWIYTKMSLTTGATPAGVVSAGPYRTSVDETWERADGRQSAGVDNGRLFVGPVRTNPSQVFSFDPLPTDPDTLLRKVGGRAGLYQPAYERLIDILAGTVHPPKEEAAIFQAIKRIPNVTLIKGRVDADGRPAVALGLEEDYLHEEVLLNPKTYAYLGDRMITIRDHWLRSEGEPSVLVKKGTLQHLRLRTAVGVVAKPGQHPA